MFKWLKKIFETKEITSLKADIAKIKAEIEANRLDIYELISTKIQPIMKRIKTKKTKDLNSSSDYTPKRRGVITPQDLRAMKEEDDCYGNSGEH